MGLGPFQTPAFLIFPYPFCIYQGLSSSVPCIQFHASNDTRLTKSCGPRPLLSFAMVHLGKLLDREESLDLST
jgi:hypothetical protein